MNGKVIRVLLVEDSAADASQVQECLAGKANPAFELHCVNRITDALAHLALGRTDALLLNLGLRNSEGMVTFRQAQEAAPSVPIVVLSSDADEDAAVEAVQAGAQDYLVKGRYDRELLARSLRYAIERKRTRQALRELAQRLTHYVSNSPLAVIEWGDDRNIIRWSGEAEHMFGWNFEEVKGKRWHDFRFVHAEDERKVMQAFSDLSAGASKNFLAHRNYRRDGSVLHCEWYNSAFPDGSGKLRSILSLVVDVTEQKQAEERLGLANRQLHQLSKELLQSQDNERRRIARELNDSTAQTLAALSINLSRLEKSETESSRKRALLAESIDLVTASSREIRTLSYLLHPPLLDEIGLASTLRTYTQGFHQRTGILIEAHVHADFGRL